MKKIGCFLLILMLSLLLVACAEPASKPVDAPFAPMTVNGTAIEIDAQAASVLAALGLSVYGVGSTADDGCVILKEEDFEQQRDLLFFAIRPLSPEVICVQKNLSLIAVVGEAMAEEVSSIVLSAIADLGERALFTASGADTLGLTLAVREEALDFAIQDRKSVV